MKDALVDDGYPNFHSNLESNPNNLTAFGHLT